MVANAQKKWTVEEYLAFERSSEEKHEYYAGEIFAMSGASREHNLVVMNTGTALNSQLAQRPCEVYPSDMRVKINSIKYTYPDVTVVCGEPRFADDEFDTLLNPTVIVEVLSESTEKYDRGKKSEHYRTLDSLQEYVLIAQDEIHTEHYIRANNKWVLTEAKTIDAKVELSSINCTLSLADVYRKVTFEADTSSTEA
ncbi:MAG: Uma2 family endonuclease [Anaerolineae bacterium]|nr:Uma2 family endonuclease [Anaerolineae bacterium]